MITDHPQLPDARRPQARDRTTWPAHLALDGYTRHQVPIPVCPQCNGYGFQDGKLARGWADHRRPGCPACGATGEHLDELVARVSGFQTFQELLEAPGDYRPTILTRQREATDPCAGIGADLPEGVHLRELRALADAYDQAQANRGDDRRAYRGG